MSERMCAVCHLRGYSACHCRLPNLDDPVEHLATPSAATTFLRAGIIVQGPRAKPAVHPITGVTKVHGVQLCLPFEEEDDNG